MKVAGRGRREEWGKKEEEKRSYYKGVEERKWSVLGQVRSLDCLKKRLCVGGGGQGCADE